MAWRRATPPKQLSSHLITSITSDRHRHSTSVAPWRVETVTQYSLCISSCSSHSSRRCAGTPMRPATCPRLPAKNISPRRILVRRRNHHDPEPRRQAPCDGDIAMPDVFAGTHTAAGAPTILRHYSLLTRAMWPHSPGYPRGSTQHERRSNADSSLLAAAKRWSLERKTIPYAT